MVPLPLMVDSGGHIFYTALNCFFVNFIYHFVVSRIYHIFFSNVGFANYGQVKYCCRYSLSFQLVEIKIAAKNVKISRVIFFVLQNCKNHM